MAIAIIRAFMRDRAKSLQDATVKSYRLSLAHVLPGVFGFDFEPVGRLNSAASFENVLHALGGRLVLEVGYNWATSHNEDTPKAIPRIELHV